MADEFSAKPYYGWLEGVIRDLVDIDPVSIALQMIDHDGEVYSCYYNLNPDGRAIIRAGLEDDDRMDWVRNNRDAIAAIMAEDEEGDGA